VSIASLDLSQTLQRLPGARLAGRSRHAHMLAARLGIHPRRTRPVAPAQPVGAKLELTYACNLRCGFCYTDSPRHTVARTVELSDDDWRAIVAELIELGVIESVVTGGEPLLRRELALELAEQLSDAGIGVTFNTNGWFVDEAVADRLATGCPGVDVHISLDGPTPQLHDGARGVPGSWRRAVKAVAVLTERGISTHVVQVVTPDNQHAVEELIEQCWLLGASSVRLAPVVPIGAAAREGSWQISRSRLRRAVERARRRFGPELPLILVPPVQRFGPVQAPTYMLVRPNGAVMAGSISPYRFGNAREQGLAASWQRIRRDWNHPNARAWREPILHGAPLEELPTLMYRDQELDIDEPPPAKPTAAPEVRLPRRARVPDDPDVGSFEGARRHVMELALARRYRLGNVRWSEADGGSRYVRITKGNVARLNATAATVMDGCAGGTPADALARILAAHPSRPQADVGPDVVATARRLCARGILAPAR
jgi:MoaA/NifB/PqqE/SkfB family radical SAM enzyme